MNLFYSWEYWAGVLSVVFYILVPHIYTWLTLKNAYVWVPFNNQHYCSGDSRFYAAGVNESRLNFLKYSHPCSNVIGGMAIDFTRASSYRLAAILCLGIRDDRYAFLVSFILSVTLQYIMLCFLFLHFFNDVTISILGSLCIIYYLNLFSSIISENKLRSFIYYLSLVSKFNTFERVNDNFRFVIMSSAGNFVWISLLFAQYYWQLPTDFFKIICLSFLIIPLLFVYPIVSAYGLFIIFWVQLIRIINIQDWYELYVIIAGITIAITIFFILGFYKRIQNIINSDLNVLIQSHSQKEVYNYGFQSFLHYVVKDGFFVLSAFSLTYLMFMDNPSSLLFGLFLFTLILRLFGYLIKKNGIITRFYERGSLHFISFGLIVILLDIYLKASSDSASILTNLFLIVVLVLPLIGSIRAAKINSKSGAFQIEKYEWDLYRFMKYQTHPRSNCLAFSYSNLQLIPVYTNANLTIRGAEWLENPFTELVKYFKALSYVKADSKSFWDGLNEYHEISLPGDINTSDNEKVYNYYHLFKTLIYYPFVESVGDIQIFDQVTKKWNEKFILRVQQEVFKTSDNFDETVDYIILDKELIPKYNIRENFECVFENNRFQLLRNNFLVSA